RGAILTRPGAELAHRLEQRAAEPGQFVIDARRNAGRHRAREQPVTLEGAQRERQHALRDRAQRLAQFIEALRSVAERRDDQHGPFVADPRQDLADRAAVLGLMQVPRYTPCAFLHCALGHLSSLGIKPLPTYLQIEVPMAKLKLGIVVGSNRRDSINRKLAHALAKLGAEAFEPAFIRIDDLPMYNQDNEQPVPATVARFKAEVESADALLFVTPEHSRSIPAVLKNAIDWGGRPYGTSVWPGKPAAVI